MTITRLIKPAFDPEFGLRRRAVGADAIFDGNDAAFILSERRINRAMIITHVAVDDGEVFLLDGAGFEDFAKFAGGCGIFGDENNAAGFTIEAVDQRRPKAGSGEGAIQIKAGAADQAGKLITLGRMTD